MTELQVHTALAWGEIAVAILVVVALQFIVAPYGRHGRSGWGPEVPNKLAWVIMESPTVWLFGAVYALGDHRAELVPLVLLGLWQFHYFYRSFVYPLRLRGTGKTMPSSIMALGFAFNSLNAYLHARWIAHFGDYTPDWLTDPRFVVGVAVFVAGVVINRHSDAVLRNLRAPGESGYKIPQGGMYRWVSSPNYLGEIIEWIGWAIATWSVPGLAFAVWTIANVGPRAFANHRWYLEKFPDYPPDRKALIPFVA